MLQRILFGACSMAAALAVSVSGAIAKPTQDNFPHWYIGLSGSLTFLDDADISNGGELSYDAGWGGAAAIGYRPATDIIFLRDTRYELEIAYRQNDIDEFTNGATRLTGNGEYKSTSYMANMYYDFRNSTGFTPYIGGGLGLAQVRVDDFATLIPGDDEDTVFAYQGMVGVSYAPSSTPNIEWNLGYRYFATEDPQFGVTAGSVDAEYSSHNAEAGVKFRF